MEYEIGKSGLAVSIGFNCTAFSICCLPVPTLPERIPTHFDINGKPDAFGGKSAIYTGPVIMGIVSLIVFALLSNLKLIDPKRAAQTNTGMFRLFGVIMAGFLSVLACGILYVTVHPGFPFEKMLLPIMGLLFATIGWFMPRLPQNYFAGLRLPWTLESETNWNATHKMAGKLWLGGGILIMLLGMMLKGAWAVGLLFGIIMVIVFIPIVFSFRMYKRGNRL